jgi:glycyl-tRNA synthetase
MSDKHDGQLMEKIVSLCKRRGFIFQSSEIYGGLNGAWDYGPLGVELKRNLKNYWWRVLVHERDDVVGMDGAILMHPEVLKASGHVEGFSDPMVDCLLTKKRFRADQIEPQSGTVYQFIGALPRSVLFDLDLSSTTPEFWKTWLFPSALHSVPELVESLRKGIESQKAHPADDAALVRAAEHILSSTVWSEFSVLVPPGKPLESARKIASQFYESRGVKNAIPFEDRTRHHQIENTRRYNPENGAELTTPRAFNLMFRTFMGATEDESSIAYLRPETAQSIFVQFKNVLEVSRKKLPFGIAQIGKAFRNEINPRNFTFRSREFEQMELEYFCRAEQGIELLEYWKEERLKFYENIGIARDKLHVRTVPDDERAFYSKGTYDIEYEFPFGRQELEGVAYRTDYDLSQHQKASGKSLEYFDEETKQRFVPHVVEPSAGVDRTVLALICEAYAEDQAPDEKGKMETRVVLRLHPRMAPIKCAVFPLLKNKESLVAKAKEIVDLLRPHMFVFYDESGAIGRRYRRQDEIGTPFGVTIDFETLGEKDASLRDTVTLRDRDSMKQERIKISELIHVLSSRIM